MAGGARKLTLESIVGASAEQLSCEMSGEAVILNLKDCCYYGLDPVGASVWRALLNGPASVAELRDRILAEFDVTPEQCEADLLQLLEEMRRTGLLEIRR
jgi:hypothetical protein